MQEEEVIADSEDESSLLESVATALKDASTIVDDTFHRGEFGTDSPIQTAVTDIRPRPTDASAILDFSSIPTRVPAVALSAASKSMDQSNISSFSKIDTSSSSVAPPKARPKPRPIKRPTVAAAAEASSSIVNASSLNVAGPSMFGSPSLLGGDGGDLNLSLADRAKMRSRPSKLTPPLLINTKSKSPPNNSNINTTSNGKSKSKKLSPKPKSATAAVFDDDVIEITSSEDEATKPKREAKPKTADSREPLFLPLSDSQMTVATIPVFTSSILPPSDPPPPSTILRSTSPRRMSDDDTDIYPPVSARKRKRSETRPLAPAMERSTDMDMDMDMDMGLGGHISTSAEDSRKMPPPAPPPFFAGSSSFSIIIPARKDRIVDSEMLDVAATGEKAKKKKEREKKLSAKKKGSDANMDMVIDVGAGASSADITPSGKSKKKAKAPKTVEVLIKSNGKAPTAKGSFKSREIIEDSDGEDGPDPLILVPSAPPIAAYVVPGSPLSSMHESEPEPPVRKEKKKAGKAKGKEKGKGAVKNGKKRVVVDSADEMDELESSVVKRKPSNAKKKKGNMVISDGEDEPAGGAVASSSKTSQTVIEKQIATECIVEPDEPLNENTSADLAVKENIRPPTDMSYLTKPPPSSTSVSISSSSKIPARAYSISRTKTTPMSELIRRVNSQPNSPFRSPKSTPSTAYSPLLKSSRSILSRIAPLHPTRKPPPPPPPPVPKAKERKTKKMLELEEKWEDELSESVDGWACLEESERETLRRRKKEMEMGWGED